MRRENKLYSYQDQLMEMELRKVGEITAQHLVIDWYQVFMTILIGISNLMHGWIHLLDGLLNVASFHICLSLFSLGTGSQKESARQSEGKAHPQTN